MYMNNISRHEARILLKNTQPNVPTTFRDALNTYSFSFNRVDYRKEIETLRNYGLILLGGLGVYSALLLSLWRAEASITLTSSESFFLAGVTLLLVAAALSVSLKATTFLQRCRNTVLSKEAEACIAYFKLGPIGNLIGMPDEDVRLYILQKVAAIGKETFSTGETRHVALFKDTVGRWLKTLEKVSNDYLPCLWGPDEDANDILLGLQQCLENGANLAEWIQEQNRRAKERDSVTTS